MAIVLHEEIVFLLKFSVVNIKGANFDHFVQGFNQNVYKTVAFDLYCFLYNLVVKAYLECLF